ncbi:MAG: YitT family protein, partial [Tannerella sp.]|nr:YitT family protein [Tannerella sp.]
GLICGAGLGIIFSSNGSTGGTDIVGAIVNKYRNISIGRALLLCDFVIIGSSYFVFHDVQKIVFGFVEMVVNNYVLDQIINANRQSVQFLIFSNKYAEIMEHIMTDLGRGCTLLDAEGGYSKLPIKVIILLAKNRESVTIFRLVKSIDQHAFISQSSVRGVYGEGFDPIKV